jgi:cbb3-type cytochrome oxidase subunit 3
MFTQALIIIAVASVVWAFWSLKKEMSRKEIDEAKTDLKRSKVLFKRS